MVPSRPRVVAAARSRPRLPSRRAAPRSPHRASRLVARPAAGSPGAPLGGDDAPIVRLALDLDAPQRAWLASLDEFRVLVLGKTGVGKSSAINALASADAAEYAALMEPEPLRFSPVFSLKLGHSEVCGFARACVAAGLEVECTAVAAPGVDLAAARALSEELGAKGFRERSWHE